MLLEDLVQSKPASRPSSSLHDNTDCMSTDPMPSDTPSHIRLRAPRACQACSLRKVKCDATEIGLPCSRCRVAKSSDCFLVPSRRGTYTRKSHQQAIRQQTSVGDDAAFNVADSSKQHMAQEPATQQNSMASSAPYAAGSVLPGPAQEPRGDTMLLDEPSGNSTGNSNTSTFESRSLERTPTPSQQRDSLKAMFERFLERQGQRIEDATDACGLIFLSGASPLTFALEEARGAHKDMLQDAETPLIASDQTGRVESDNHPAHLTAPDIAYLKAKGAFERPKAEVLDCVRVAFMDRFYPLYSIVDPAKFTESCKAGTLPWILLHAFCFIGSTFCDPSVLHRAGFEDRWHARRQFYDRAKVLFDVGYETNKIVLLQSVLMLSFWGPQMKSYWNPCSWVGFGVTIAESLGIHRMGSSAHVDSARRGLLKRLFWTLAVRDAYCAALLGRPCRLNIVQCNTELPSLEDFDHPAHCSSPEDHRTCQSHAHYQIQVSRLSFILRDIIKARFCSSQSESMTAHLHSQLEAWQAELPPSVSWEPEPNQSPNLFSLSLKIIFHLQLVLIHLERPEDAMDSASSALFASSSSSNATESAAHTIASTAFTIISNSMLAALPHEVFLGFFVAGIVFYRGIRNNGDNLDQLPRSALDNCQMVLSQARESWDPANWVLKIFDFLLSRSVNKPRKTGQPNHTDSVSSSQSSLEPGLGMSSNNNGFQDTLIDPDALLSFNFGSPSYQDLASISSDFLPGSSFLPMSPGSNFFKTG